ncbi:O-methyltransferase [Bhargavaea ullalensis]|uniref:tRNA 5-hydroxyuridine methyltransferase n=1 Tax=Bhargavaea ullalensis TaxID=1265685 RepID=A0ABV2G8S4_9BACL
MEHDYSGYTAGLIRQRPDHIMEMEKYAAEHRVPIMQLEGIEALLQILRIQRPARILEIGTAIGYSAIRMGESLPEAEIVTIERDGQMREQAAANLRRSPAGRRITVIAGDALELGDNMPEGPFDALFIDAAKGQYRKFFDLYEPLLSAGAVIYCDNMFMHGLAADSPEDVPKRNRSMIRKLRAFTEWIMDHPGYDSALLPAGDGLLVSKKKDTDREGAAL